jgi:hypothetical protein
MENTMVYTKEEENSRRRTASDARNHMNVHKQQQNEKQRGR